MATPNGSEQARKVLAAHKGEVLKLDVGCGDNKLDGHIGMDIVAQKGVDVVWDMTKAPWPFPDNTFTLISSSHSFEHVTREGGAFIRVMNECWRVLKFDGQMRVATPYGGSTMFWADPTHVNGIVPQTFHYFDPLAPLKTYHVYKPKPWKIEQMYWSPDGILECLLTKRRPDPSYGKR